MFKFSIRDLLWLTLVVAMALAWLLREVKLRDEVDQNKWRLAAGGLEHLIGHDGWVVAWDFKSSEVLICKGAEPGSFCYGGFLQEPTAPTAPGSVKALSDKVAIRVAPTPK